MKSVDTTALDAVNLLKDHGGRPALLAQALGIPQSELLDFSNAVSPFAYPLGDIPAGILADLPYESTELREAAAAYYAVTAAQVLAASGSQQIIQALPALRKRSTVLLPRLGYAEHARHWQAGGHRCVFYPDMRSGTVADCIQAEQADVLVLINPNNPTGERSHCRDILRWRSLLPADGQIVVDEAFIDVEPDNSAATLLSMDGLIVLRSVGKFFGVPGLRLGFALANEAMIIALRKQLGPWAINAVAQWAGGIMLRDLPWQQRARERLRDSAGEQYRRLRSSGLRYERSAATPYFSAFIMPHPQAQSLCAALLAQRIAVRYYDQHPDFACLRIGLSSSETGFARLVAALQSQEAIQESLSIRAI